jgi:hypothetical protein
VQPEERSGWQQLPHPSTGVVDTETRMMAMMAMMANDDNVALLNRVAQGGQHNTDAPWWW